MAVGLAAGEEIVVILPFAFALRGLRQCPVRDGVFETVSDRFVELIGNISVPLVEVQPPVVAHGRTLHRFVGFRPVEAAESFQQGVGHHGDGRIADHAVGFAAHQVPDGKFALLFVDAQHRIDQVADLFGMDERQQGMRRAVGVPKREGGVIGEGRVAADRSVGAAVVAVHVAEERRRDHGVVKRCVEDPSHRRIGCFDADFRQLAVPCPAGGFAHGFEIPAGALRLHVPPGIFRGNGRKPDLDGDAFVLLRPKTEASVEFPPAGGAAVGGERIRAGEDDPFEGLREFGVEVDALVVGPARRISPALDRTVAACGDAAVGGAVPALPVFEVEDDTRVVRCGEGVAAHSDARRGGQLDADAVAQQASGIVARRAPFVGAAETGPHARRRIAGRAASRRDFADDRHQRDVVQVADARAAQVRVTEPDDGRVGVIVAGAPVPCLRDARRTELYESERDVGAHEDVSVVARADVGIDVLRVILRHGGTACAAEQRGDCREKDDAFHNSCRYTADAADAAAPAFAGPAAYGRSPCREHGRAVMFFIAVYRPTICPLTSTGISSSCVLTVHFRTNCPSGMFRGSSVNSSTASLPGAISPGPDRARCPLSVR